MDRFMVVAVIFSLIVGCVYALSQVYDTVFAVVQTAHALSTPYDPKARAAAAALAKPVPLTGFAQKFSNSLMVIGDDGAPHSFDAQKLAGVKYWAFYYSASWCPPCRAFTPDLVSFYKDFKPSHPDFELIFVNDDQNQDDMIAYMKNDGMTWPAVWFADIDNPDLQAKKYCGDGIPDLVLVDADGNVISDTVQGGQYTDPHHVIDDIRANVK